MAGQQSPNSGVRRLASVTVALMAAGATAACGSGSSGSTTTTAPLSAPAVSLGPWQGTLAVTTLPAPIQSLRAVTCPTARRCWAVGSTFATSSAPAVATLVTTADGGATWRVQSLPPGLGYLSGIACASTRACTAVGQVGLTGVGPGAIVTTSDGGANWSLQTVPAGTTDVTAVACRQTGRCLALGVVSGQLTTLTPSTTGAWSAGSALSAPASVATALVCTDGNHCWATADEAVDVGHIVGIIVATSNDGATWIRQQLPVGTGALQGIDCRGVASTSSPAHSPGASCTAVGTTASVLGVARTGHGVILTSANSGSTWVSAPVAPSAADLFGVSCAAGPCVAVGTTVPTSAQAGVVILSGADHAAASAWRSAVARPLALPLAAVACVSLSACVVVGESASAHLASG